MIGSELEQGRTMEATKMRERQQHYIDCIERLNGGAIDRLEWAKLHELLDQLTDGLPLVLHPLTTSAKIGRGRVLQSPEKFATIDELAYPPEDKCTSYGRCNFPRKPMLYAGVGSELIFSEIGARTGDYVGLLHMKSVRDILCVRLGALNLWRRTSGHCLMDNDTKDNIKNIWLDPNNIVAFLLDAFIADYFSRTGSTSVYKLTSAYTSSVVNVRPDIAGLIYDSVDHTAGACLAIKPHIFDTMMQPTEVQIVKVTTYLGYGVFDFEQVAFANRFDHKIIHWD